MVSDSVTLILSPFQLPVLTGPLPAPSPLAYRGGPLLHCFLMGSSWGVELDLVLTHSPGCFGYTGVHLSLGKIQTVVGFLGK